MRIALAMAALALLAVACAPEKPRIWPATLAIDTVDPSPVFAKLRGPAGPVRFAQVDEHVYRGGQPTNAQLDDLYALGVRTVVSLRDEDPRTTKIERAHAESLGMRFVHVPFSAQSPIEVSVVDRVLATLGDDSAGKVYVHCHIGRDRTSLMVALHLVMNRGWDPKVAWQRAALDYGHVPYLWFRPLRLAFDRTSRGRKPLQAHAPAPPALDVGTLNPPKKPGDDGPH